MGRKEGKEGGGRGRGGGGERSKGKWRLKSLDTAPLLCDIAPVLMLFLWEHTLV